MRTGPSLYNKREEKPTQAPAGEPGGCQRALEEGSARGDCGRLALGPSRAAVPSPLRTHAHTCCIGAAGRRAHGRCHAATFQRNKTAVLHLAAEVHATASLVLTSIAARRSYRSFSLAAPDSGRVNKRQLLCIKSYLCFSGGENAACTAVAESRNS